MKTQIKISKNSDPVNAGQKPMRQKPVPYVLQAYKNQTIQLKTINRTGLPDNLKSGIEHLSGLSMDNVRVHYNSDKPAQLQSLAYTQGTNIHVAPGQERHLPHEAWHVVQQMQGRVKPTTQLKGIHINDASSLEQEAEIMGERAIKGGNGFPSFQRKSETGVGNTIQLFRFVLPRTQQTANGDNSHYNVTQGDLSFTTHQIVHKYNNQNAFIGGINLGNYSGIDQNVHKQLEESIHFSYDLQWLIKDISTVNNKLDTIKINNTTDLQNINPIFSRINSHLTDFITFFKNYPTIIAIINNKNKDLFTKVEKNNNFFYQNIKYIVEKKISNTGKDVNFTFLDIFRKNIKDLTKNTYYLHQFISQNYNLFYSNYFGNLGRTADPQRPGSLIGHSPYLIKGEGDNVLSESSQFDVLFVTSNASFPLLVSQNNRFAINAMYSDPKEVFMTGDALYEANRNLNRIFISLGYFGNTINIGGKTLWRCGPIFNGDKASTHACNEFRDKYYINNNDNLITKTTYPTDPKIIKYIKENFELPWELHTAGKLCVDGVDTLSLENGARTSFLVNRGKIKQQTIGKKLSEDKFIQEQLNATWYFRIYGPNHLGQDITNQTLARFPKKHFGK